MKPSYAGIDLYASLKTGPATCVVTFAILNKVRIDILYYTRALYYIQFTPYAKTHCFARYSGMIKYMQEIFEEKIGNETNLFWN